MTKDDWLDKTEVSYDIDFKKLTMKSSMYDILVSVYVNGFNRLHLFDADRVNERIVTKVIAFDITDIKHILNLFL